MDGAASPSNSVIKLYLDTLHLVSAHEGGSVPEGDPGAVRHAAAAEVQHHHQGAAQGGVQGAEQAAVLPGHQVKTTSPDTATHSHTGWCGRWCGSRTAGTRCSTCARSSTPSPPPSRPAPSSPRRAPARPRTQRPGRPRPRPASRRASGARLATGCCTLLSRTRSRVTKTDVQHFTV